MSSTNWRLPTTKLVEGMPSTWSIHYDRWVIEDGEPEREVGECFRWPIVAFGCSAPLTQAISHIRSAIDVEDYSYNIVGQVAHVSSEAVVLDFGLRAAGASNLVPAGCQAAEYVAGRIKLFFQHWYYPLPQYICESLEQVWSVEAILADLTPYRAGDEAGWWFIRDEQNVRYEPVKSTREKRARAYALRCRLLHSEASVVREEPHSS